MCKGYGRTDWVSRGMWERLGVHGAIEKRLSVGVGWG